MVELELGDETVVLTSGELDEILREIDGSRHMPKDEQLVRHDQGETEPAEFPED